MKPKKKQNSDDFAFKKGEKRGNDKERRHEFKPREKRRAKNRVRNRTKRLKKDTNATYSVPRAHMCM